MVERGRPARQAPTPPQLAAKGDPRDWAPCHTGHWSRRDRLPPRPCLSYGAKQDGSVSSCEHHQVTMSACRVDAETATTRDVGESVSSSTSSGEVCRNDGDLSIVS